VLSVMKRWLTDARVLNLQRQVEDKERELREYEDLVKDLSEGLKQAEGAVQKADDVVGGLTESVGMLQERNSANYQNYLVTLATLVAWAGGSVSIDKEMIDAVTSGPVTLDYRHNADGSLTLTLTTAAPEEAAACNDECACECLTGDQVVS
jgi:hypothetical protein